MSNLREDHWVEDAGRGSLTDADYAAGDAAYDAARDDAADYVAERAEVTGADPWSAALAVRRARTMSSATAARITNPGF